jgi:hypothetical protein
VFGDSVAANKTRDRASDYLAAHHSASRYVDAMQDWLGAAAATRTTATQPVPHPQAAPAPQAR